MLILGILNLLVGGLDILLVVLAHQFNSICIYLLFMSIVLLVIGLILIIKGVKK